MTEMVVLAFETENGAKDALGVLEGLQKEKMLFLEDAAVLVRKADGQVKLDQAVNLVGAGALGGGLWGLLIGALFMAPWMGLALGAVVGAFAGKNVDIGLDDDFIKDVGETIQPGHSALFMMVRDVVPEAVITELKKLDLTLLRSSLSPTQEENLRLAFSGGETEE